MYNKDKCHNNTRANLMTKKNGNPTEKDFPKQSGNYAPEIRNKETGGMYYNHSTIYKKEPDPFDDVKQTVPTAKEKVNHPDHYNAGKIEVIDAIEDWGLDFIEGNVIKYVARSHHKSSRIGDLKKARWYLNYLINKLEKS